MSKFAKNAQICNFFFPEKKGGGFGGVKSKSLSVETNLHFVQNR